MGVFLLGFFMLFSNELSLVNDYCAVNEGVEVVDIGGVCETFFNSAFQSMFKENIFGLFVDSEGVGNCLKLGGIIDNRTSLLEVFKSVMEPI